MTPLKSSTVDLLVKVGIVYFVWKFGIFDMIAQGISGLADATKPGQGTNSGTFG